MPNRRYIEAALTLAACIFIGAALLTALLILYA